MICLRRFGVMFLCGCFCLAGRAAEIWVAGISEPFLDITLSASTNGTVASIHVAEGDSISKNQILLELEKKTEELEVERRRLVLEDKSELTVAAAQVLTLKMDFDSTKKLFEATGSISKEALAAKEMEYKKAIGTQDLMEATEKRQGVELLLGKELLRQKTIRSPLKGRVVELFMDVGEGCKPQDPLIRIVDISKFYFEANVEAEQGERMKVNDTAEIALGSRQKPMRLSGRLSFVSPIVDPGSGLVRIRVLCENSGEQIKPGMDGYLILEGP